MSYPPHLLDALGRVYAKVALDRLIKDEMAKQAELQNEVQPAADPEKECNVGGPVSVESSDNREHLLPEPRP